MSERHTFRVRGAASLADAADAIRNGAELSVSGVRSSLSVGRTAPQRKRISTAAMNRETSGFAQTAERVQVRRDGGHRAHQVREATRANRQRSATGRTLVAIDTPQRPTRLPIGAKIPNTGRAAMLNDREHRAQTGAAATPVPEWRGTSFPVKSGKRK